MTKYEELIGEYEQLIIEERPMENEGLYADGCVWINKNMSANKKACILAEEIGHYETTSGDILDQTDTGNRKQELIARKWAYEKLIPVEAIQTAINNGYTEIWNIAEFLEVDEAFLKDALQYYGYLSA